MIVRILACHMTLIWQSRQSFSQSLLGVLQSARKIIYRDERDANKVTIIALPKCEQ